MLSAPERLSLVREISGRASDSEQGGCVYAGVDVLLRSKQHNSRLPLKKVAAYLKDNALAVLPADKGGGFAVLSTNIFNSRASAAVSSVFKCDKNGVISKLQSEVKKLCEKLNLTKLASGRANSKKDFPEVFFSAKTHKQTISSNHFRKLHLAEVRRIVLTK